MSRKQKLLLITVFEEFLINGESLVCHMSLLLEDYKPGMSLEGVLRILCILVLYSLTMKSFQLFVIVLLLLIILSYVK